MLFVIREPISVLSRIVNEIIQFINIVCDSFVWKIYTLNKYTQIDEYLFS